MGLEILLACEAVASWVDKIREMRIQFMHMSKLDVVLAVHELCKAVVKQGATFIE